MVRISEEEIQRLRDQADIVDVISHYVPVERKGNTYRAKCPFHNDHDPSMQINPDMKIYKCFVCGNGGSVFRFVQNYEKISFPEAVGKVADIIGFQLSEKPQSFQKPVDPHIEKLRHVLEEAVQFTTYQLDTPEAMDEKEYLEKRGLHEDVRKAFDIGYNPTGNALSRFLKAKGFTEKDMVAANLSRMSENGIYDVFAGRITFPIHDEQGHPIGFSARTIQPGVPSKYINTTETDLFKKGDLVYNYHRAKNSARHDGKIYVCEGVTDVIAFYQAGLENAVCTLGTSCTDHQIHLIKKMAAQVVFCYDGDRAGQAATYRAGKMARAIGCEVAVVLNHTQKDPDEIIREGGKDALIHMVSTPISWMEFVLHYLKSETNLNSYLEKKEMFQKAQEEFKTLSDPVDRQYFADELFQITGFRLENEQIHQKTRPVHEEYLQKLVAPHGAAQAEKMILSMMMQSAEASRLFEEKLGYLIGKEAQSLALLIVDEMHEKGYCDTASLLDKCDNPSMQAFISSIAMEKSVPFDENVMSGAIRRIKIEALNEQAKQLQVMINEQLNQASLKVLMDKYFACLQEKRELIDEESMKK